MQVRFYATSSILRAILIKTFIPDISTYLLY